MAALTNGAIWEITRKNLVDYGSTGAALLLGCFMSILLLVAVSYLPITGLTYLMSVNGMRDTEEMARLRRLLKAARSRIQELGDAR